MHQLLTYHEAFKDLAAGAQSIAVILAVIGGAIWTLFTFTALGSATRAKRELQQQAVVNISTTAVQVKIPEHDGFGIGVEANLTNVGNRNIVLDFEGQIPILIMPVHFDNKGASTQGELLGGNLGWVGAVVLRAGASQGFAYVGSVPRQGVYYVEFRVMVSEAEQQIEEIVRLTGKGDPTEHRQILWSGITYVVVTDPIEEDIAPISTGSTRSTAKVRRPAPAASPVA